MLMMTIIHNDFDVDDNHLGSDNDNVDDDKLFDE